jgi:hypothetical protein
MKRLGGEAKDEAVRIETSRGEGLIQDAILKTSTQLEEVHTRNFSQEISKGLEEKNEAVRVEKLNGEVILEAEKVQYEIVKKLALEQQIFEDEEKSRLRYI